MFRSNTTYCFHLPKQPATPGNSLNSSYAKSLHVPASFSQSRFSQEPTRNRSISDYLHEMESLFGMLYSNLVASFRTRYTTISFADLFEKLLDHERPFKDP
ncbi:hypothetical protein R6Q59_000548 [Mikania micrantha]